MNNKIVQNEIPNTGVHVSSIGLGGAPLSAFLFDVDENVAVSTIKRAFQLGMRYFDTAPYYGFGRGERRYGRALAEFRRTDFKISTKVGRVLIPADLHATDDGFVPHELDAVADYSRDGVMRSVDESLKRLHMDHIDIVYVHDPESNLQQAIDESVPALSELKAQGTISAVGVAMNQWEMLDLFVKECELDCILLAGRYTIIDYSALSVLLPRCEEMGTAVILGAPYHNGVLCSDLSQNTYYYTSRESKSMLLPIDKLELARNIKVVCQRYAVPLKAVALQFGLAHPAVISTIPGSVTSGEIEDNLKMINHSIPTELWSELKYENLLPQEAPTP